jgi:hypothetical protein
MTALTVSILGFPVAKVHWFMLRVVLLPLIDDSDKRQALFIGPEVLAVL